ncbi:MAG TPA: prepilin-type N-terminal cleavage/methylation domain-containing protein [Verrucomicrobiae bacterium]
MKSPAHNFRSRGGGFTLIEIMIAITIFAVVMAAIYSTWSSILRGSRVGMKAATEVQRMRVSVRALEEALGSAVMYVDNAKYYTFATDTSGNTAYISFVARLPGSFPGSGLFGDQELRRVCFYVEDGNLMLRQAPLLEATKRIGKPYEIALAPNVSLFDMEFYDGMANKWYAEWISTNQLPKMVRIALSFSPNTQGRRPENITIRSIPLAGVAITRGGAGVMGGSGNGLAPNLRNSIGTPAARLHGEDDAWDPENLLLPSTYRSGANFGNKTSNPLFPPQD